MPSTHVKAIQGVTGRSPLSATLSLPRSRPHTHFHSADFSFSLPDRNQSSCQKPSRRGTIFLLVRGMYIPGISEVSKGVAIAPQPLLQRPIPRHRTPVQPSRDEPRQSATEPEQLGFELTRIIHEHFCCNRQSTATTSLRQSVRPSNPHRTARVRIGYSRTPRAGLCDAAQRFRDEPS